MQLMIFMWKSTPSQSRQSEKRKKAKLEPMSMILKETQGGKDLEKLTEKKQRGQKIAKKMK